MNLVSIFTFFALLTAPATAAIFMGGKGQLPRNTDLLELSSEWWDWALCTDPDMATYSMRDCADQGLVRDGWLFLAGSGEDEQGQIIVRECDGIPNNLFILIPVVNVICDQPFFDLCYTFTFEPYTYTLDGTNVKVQSVSDIIQEWEPSCDYDLVQDYAGIDNLFAGKWLVIPPLSVGEHVIAIEGGIPELPFTTEVTHTLTVVPAGKGK